MSGSRLNSKGATSLFQKGPITYPNDEKGPLICMRTSHELSARILHGSARHFVLCSACRCQDYAPSGQVRLIKALILLNKMVLPDRIELSTSPLPMECSTTELRQRARYENRPKGLTKARRSLPQGPQLRKRGGRPARPSKTAQISAERPPTPSAGSVAGQSGSPFPRPARPAP